MRAAATMVRHALRGRARLELELSEVPLVRASEARLCQVFVNLLVNAADATPAGSPDAHPIRLWARARDGDVIAEVRDCGAGIAPDVLPHVFEPFFTTKGPSGGSGLGLSVCHGIVTALGGRLEVESAPGRGSVFRVRLPAMEDVARRAPGPAAERRVEAGGDGCAERGVAAGSVASMRH